MTPGIIGFALVSGLLVADVMILNNKIGECEYQLKKTQQELEEEKMKVRNCYKILSDLNGVLKTHNGALIAQKKELEKHTKVLAVMISKEETFSEQQ